VPIRHPTYRPVPAHRQAGALAWSVAALSILVPALSAQASHRGAPAVPPDHLSIDPAVITGTLPNGLRYYIRPNAVPAHRAELRLVVDAGSGLEDSTQRGLAHFVEHMAFSGTTHFKQLDLVRYRESMGMQDGADLNATTTYDATSYRFTVPTDRPDAVATGIRMLADWAHGITFDSAAVEAERGIILGEWRSRTDAGGSASRSGDRFLAQVLRGSPYATRPPLGEPAIVATAPRAELTRFYRDWYRPDRMAVIIVGDIEAKAVEALIRRHLGAIRRAAGERRRPALAVPPWAEPTLTVAVDSLGVGAVTVAYRLMPREHGTVAGFRVGLVERMLAYVLSEHLSDADRGTIDLDEPVRGMRTYTLRAWARDGDTRLALARLLGVVQQVLEHGLTPDEFARVRSYTMGEYENLYEHRAARTSATLADALATGALDGSVLLGADQTVAVARRALSGPDAITLDEVNAAARAILSQPGRVVFVVASPYTSAGVPSEQAIARVVDSVARTPTPAFTGQVAATLLVPVAPASGRVDSVRTLDTVGAQEWVLSNGARVILKPTDFDANQVLVKAIAPGGTSLAADSDYVNAVLAALAVEAGGVGDLSLPVLQKRLRNTAPTVTIRPFITELSQGVTGGAAPRDVAAMLQLLHLVFTAPREDVAAIAAWRDRFRAELATGQAETAAAIHRLLVRGHPRARQVTAAMVDSLDPARALAFYRARFADAGAFTFVLVGAFDPDSIRPLVERWIGGLPSTRAHETWRDLGARPATGPGGIDADVAPPGLTTVQLVMGGPMSYDPPENLVLNALAEIAQRRLVERLRTDLHATYGVQVSTTSARWPWAHYEINVHFEAAPEQADSLAAAALAVLDSLRASGPTAREAADAKALEARRFELGRRDNGYWLETLSDNAWNGWEYATRLTSVAPLLDALAPERLHSAAARLLDTAHVIRIAIRPRKPAP
jgi:zinc protease